MILSLGVHFPLLFFSMGFYNFVSPFALAFPLPELPSHRFFPLLSSLNLWLFSPLSLVVPIQPPTFLYAEDFLFFCSVPVRTEAARLLSRELVLVWFCHFQTIAISQTSVLTSPEIFWLSRFWVWWDLATVLDFPCLMSAFYPIWIILFLPHRTVATHLEAGKNLNRHGCTLGCTHSVCLATD